MVLKMTLPSGRVGFPDARAPLCPTGKPRFADWTGALAPKIARPDGLPRTELCFGARVFCADGASTAPMALTLSVRHWANGIISSIRRIRMIGGPGQNASRPKER